MHRIGRLASVLTVATGMHAWATTDGGARLVALGIVGAALLLEVCVAVKS